ncbi:MAG TPA: 30S ribosomal protein S20 [Acidimicrobiales bacterium]|nr:30S ribosomal protein S20 [Acidimicrobiales bacterium]
MAPWYGRPDAAPMGGATGDVVPQVERRLRWAAVANIKSQIKRNRQNERLRLRNKSVKSEVKTRVKMAVANPSPDTLREAVKKLDMAAAKGIIHKNQAANRKSRLMKRLARESATSS